MRMSRLVGKTIRENPRDAVCPSHIFLIRGGYVRLLSAGIYSLLPLANRVCQKIEKIIRDEMDGIGCQEVKMPVVLPRAIWDESGRYESVGGELLRFKDRNQKDMVLGMTHEEAVVHFIRTEINTYKKLPAKVYQIQTKYRDEARPRAGLIRVREFTMKDAYSFHTDNDCLQKFYHEIHEAYVRIFEKVGLKQCVSIQSDAGMMGGAMSHEFMAVSESGEDTIFLSPEYQANREIAKSPFVVVQESPKDLEKVETPNKRTIEELANFLKVPTSQTGKAVFYTTEEGLVFVVIRGDLEVNEVKLKNHLGISQLRPSSDEEIKAVGAVPGYASPIGLDPGEVKIVFDPTAKNSSNLVVGANEENWHYLNFNFTREMKSPELVDVVDIATVREGDPCPVTGKPLEMKRGIEVGNIFQLGTRYSEAMNCRFLDTNGKSHPMVMGSYGIGVGRTMASVIEQSHDDYGPIWPESIAPYKVHLCALNYNKEAVKEAAEKLYATLLEKGVEVLIDDRNEKAGSVFNDADLLGIPHRIILSPKTLEEGKVEYRRRDSKDKVLLTLEEVSKKF